MALQDAFGNYHCDIQPVLPPAPPSRHCCSSGDGAPSDADGSDGMYYLDLITGDVYFKSNGTWNLFTGGGSGTLCILGTDPDPNLTQARPPGTIYVDTALKTLWVKESGAGLTVWLQYV